MPHLSIEYSANLDARVDIDALCALVLRTVLETGLFETGAVRVRAFRAEAYAVADQLPENAFIDMSLRIGTGRSADDKKRTGEADLRGGDANTSPRCLTTPHFALSLEIREIDPVLSWKKNAIHAAAARQVDGSRDMSDLEEQLRKAEGLSRPLSKRDGVLNHIGGEAMPARRWRDLRDDLAGRSEAARPGRARQGAPISTAPPRPRRRPSRPGRPWLATRARSCCTSIADAIVARAEEIAFVECMDTGQALRFMAKAALRGAENFRFFADRAPEARDGQTLRAAGQINITTRAPIGPVGIITPWNTPFMLSTWKIAPALAAGCTVVHKPAEFSPLTARLLVEIAEEAGLPQGRLEPGQRLRRGCRQGADRASRHQGDRLRRRKPHRLDDHGAGRRHAEARAFRTRRQEPGDRLRRCRSGPRGSMRPSS